MDIVKWTLNNGQYKFDSGDSIVYIGQRTLDIRHWTWTLNNGHWKIDTNFEGKVVRGKNTPVKRKLMIDKQVSMLVSKFNSNIHQSEILPECGGYESESPAKRQKRMPGVRHPIS